jgi:hypothetical protein
MLRSWVHWLKGQEARGRRYGGVKCYDTETKEGREA